MQLQRSGGVFLRYIFILKLAKHIGNNVKIDPGVIINNIEKLSIGDNVSINPYCFLIASGGITIGSNVSIAHHTSIISESHTWEDEDTPISYNPIEPPPVTKDDDVWVGCGARIIGTCHIQSRTIIAAGAVVKGELESGCIYGGIPAKIMKRIANGKNQTRSMGPG